ncbi:MAG: hypothetical protein JWN70_4315 [Planctomycetaceae bacterium]|nr:hypothetical protein [Planctomycetaceae bacterium]
MSTLTPDEEGRAWRLVLSMIENDTAQQDAVFEELYHHPAGPGESSVDLMKMLAAMCGHLLEGADGGTEEARAHIRRELLRLARGEG